MDDSDPRNWDWDDTPEGSYLFDDIMFGKQDDDDPQRTNTIDDDKKLSGKLREMVAAMITAVPSLSEEHAMHLSGPIDPSIRAAAAEADRTQANRKIENIHAWLGGRGAMFILSES
jgi:hypothetical protein